MIKRSFALSSIAVLPLALLLSGCAITSTGSKPSAAGVSLHGTLHGGQQPIAGAHIYLMAASAASYGHQSISLLRTNFTGYADSHGGYVPTGADGSFDITGDYFCAPNSQVYLYALGGDPGAGVNSASGLMAVLGNCPSSGDFAASIPYVTINEVSTVAAAYALAPYAVDATHVASSGTPLALTGIANAFANARNLADLASGSALATTPNGNGSVPQAEINLLANILAACINSTGPGSTNCSTLLGAATSDGTVSGTAPSDTATAMLNIVHNPGANTAALFNLPPALSPFAPALSAQPNDFTLAVAFTSSDLQAPASIAFDAAGNAWVANSTGNTLSVYSPLGVPLTGSPFSGNGLNAPSQIAIDNNGNAWVANNGGTSISEFSPAGSAVSGSPFSGGGVSAPDSLAIDPLGNVWIANPATNNVTLLTTSGTPSALDITGSGLANPFGVAIDQTGNAWIVNQSSNSVTILDSTGAPLVNSPISGDGLNSPSAISVDGSRNSWIANTGNSSLTVLDHGGSPISGSPFTGGGISSPVCTAFDGAGNVWVANSQGHGVTELTGSGAAVTGSPFIQASLSVPDFIAVDGAGSVWIANSYNNTLTEILGSAVPAVTPIATATMNNTVGTRP